ncbi:30S ribosomal protein S6--L-glutamate ligase [soil metagenome]
MNVVILSRGPELYSTRRLVEACETRGHSVRVLDTLRCTCHMSARGAEVHYNGEPVTGVDAVIPRIGSTITFYGLAVVRQFESMGVHCSNGSIAITRSRDKLRAHQMLSKKGIGLPVTAFAHHADSAEDLIRAVGGAPLIVKLLEGTQGVGVVLCETKKAAESVIQAFRGLKAYLLVQEFIKEAGGSDLRCLVIGDKVVAAMERRGAEGEFRSNLHRGGTAAAVKISPQERKTAVLAAKALNLQVAGVDILRSNRGPLVLEVNSSPGLEGIERATGKDVAALIVQNLEKRPQKRKTADSVEGELANGDTVSLKDTAGEG